eukprot:4795982-Prymnesium_polylepis.1
MRERLSRAVCLLAILKGSCAVPAKRRRDHTKVCFSASVLYLPNIPRIRLKDLLKIALFVSQNTASSRNVVFCED